METQAKLAVIQRILAEKKAEDIEVIDLAGRTLVADYFVIATGTSNTHIKALADALLVDGKKQGLKKDHAEGYAEGRWVLIDYEDVIVHVFASDERAYYDLESLWRQTAARREAAP